MRTAALVTMGVMLTVATAPGQDPDSSGTPVYRVEFTLNDGANPAPAARRYVMLVQDNSKSILRVGNRVPYTTTSTRSSGNLEAHYQYFDSGVNIDCHTQTVGKHVKLNADVEVSSAQGNGTGAGQNPIVLSARAGVAAQLEVGKRVQVTSMDDPVTHRTMSIDVLVARAN